MGRSKPCCRLFSPLYREEADGRTQSRRKEGLPCSQGFLAFGALRSLGIIVVSFNMSKFVVDRSETFGGSLSAVSTPISAVNALLERSCEDLQITQHLAGQSGRKLLRNAQRFDSK